MSSGVGGRCGSDPALLSLWCRPATIALIGSLAWEPPYAVGGALKRQKKGGGQGNNKASQSRGQGSHTGGAGGGSGGSCMRYSDHQGAAPPWPGCPLRGCSWDQGEAFPFLARKPQRPSGACLLGASTTEDSASISFFFFFLGHTRGIWRFPGQESNWSCSCQPTPQP